MQQTPSPLPEDYQNIAEKVRTGEYFNEAQAMYDLAVHDVLAERYLYIWITGLAVLIFITALSGRSGLFPLQSPVPFIVSTDNITDEFPHITQLIQREGETPSYAVLRFLVNNYVKLREEYDIDMFDSDINGVKSQSADDVFKEFQKQVDPRNPDSPITLYQRYSKRKIEIISSRQISEHSRSVTFEATVETKGESKKTQWDAYVAFDYGGIALNPQTGKTIPIDFTVTNYNVKRIQE